MSVVVVSTVCAFGVCADASVFMITVWKRVLLTSVRSFAWQSLSHNNQLVASQKNWSIHLNRLGALQQQVLRKMSAETLEKPKIIFVLGAPGSGKGTQCSNIVDTYNYVHLSAGDLLRAERNRPGSELAQTIEEHIQAGKIIPVAVTCSLIERAMNEQMKVSFVGVRTKEKTGLDTRILRLY